MTNSQQALKITLDREVAILEKLTTQIREIDQVVTREELLDIKAVREGVHILMLQALAELEQLDREQYKTKD